MPTLREQTDLQMNKTREMNPDFAKEVDKLLGEAKTFKLGSSALNVNEVAPHFILPNAVGENVSLQTLLRRGPTVITFYRGSWCPYCNLQLRALEERLNIIRELGAELVAISPQKPDESLSIIEKQNLSFPVLSDQDAIIAKAYGVAWEVPLLLRQHMQNDRGLDLEKINNGNSSILPIPATFIVDQESKITWRYVDADYRNRSEPADIIDELKVLLNRPGLR